MRNRYSALAAALVVPLALTLVACQAPWSRPVTDTGPSLRTPWGEADLQGIWTDATETPLERPAQFAGKEFFTDEERAELDEQRGGLRRFDTRSEAGTPLDVAGAYNAVYQSVKKTGRRTVADRGSAGRTNTSLDGGGTAAGGGRPEGAHLIRRVGRELRHGTHESSRRSRGSRLGRALSRQPVAGVQWVLSDCPIPRVCGDLL